MTIHQKIGLMLVICSIGIPGLTALLYASTQAVKYTIRDRRCSFFEGVWIALWPAIAIMLFLCCFTLGLWLMN